MKCLALLLLIIAPLLAQAEPDPRIEASRDLSAKLQTALGKELQAAMQSGGPVAALNVCNEQAPRISRQLSTAEGVHLGRTALRLRNPANAPDDHARATLLEFEKSLTEKRSVVPEAFLTREDGSARFMRAIYLQPLCSACHGQGIAPAVSAAIQQHYPADQATGFAVGDLRGAFIVDWPASKEDSP